MGKSLDNGFSAEDHFYAVRRIKTLYRNAKDGIPSPDKYNDPNIKAIWHFNSKVTFKDGRTANAYLTVKEFVRDETKIYSLELKK